jgi:hypothetical protein
MGTNMALKRAARANRRKAIVAQKRRLELVAGSLSERVRRAAKAPIQNCLLTEPLWETGAGVLLLTRGVTADHLDTAVFLIDKDCLGIKDVIFGTFDAEKLEAFINESFVGQTFIPVDPSYARKLLRDLAAWARSHGIVQPRDFVAVEQLFGDISAGECNAVFEFGRDGKPAYIQGLIDTPTQVQQALRAVAEGSKVEEGS